MNTRHSVDQEPGLPPAVCCSMSQSHCSLRGELARRTSGPFRYRPSFRWSIRQNLLSSFTWGDGKPTPSNSSAGVTCRRDYLSQQPRTPRDAVRRPSIFTQVKPSPARSSHLPELKLLPANGAPFQQPVRRVAEQSSAFREDKKPPLN